MAELVGAVADIVGVLFRVLMPVEHLSKIEIDVSSVFVEHGPELIDPGISLEWLQWRIKQLTILRDEVSVGRSDPVLFGKIARFAERFQIGCQFKNISVPFGVRYHGIVNPAAGGRKGKEFFPRRLGIVVKLSQMSQGQGHGQPKVLVDIARRIDIAPGHPKAFVVHERVKGEFTEQMDPADKRISLVGKSDDVQLFSRKSENRFTLVNK